jgi:hypothetical protein
MTSDSTALVPVIDKRTGTTITYAETKLETRPYVKSPHYTWEQLKKMTFKQKRAAFDKSRRTRIKLKKAINILEQKLSRLEQYREQRNEIYKAMADLKIKKGSDKWNALWARSKKITEILSLYDDIKIDIERLKQRYHLEEENASLIGTSIQREIL